jgi:hypothetical protein
MTGRKKPAKEKINEKEFPNHRPGSGNHACPFAICRPREEHEGAHREDYVSEDASQEAYAQVLIKATAAC